MIKHFTVTTYLYDTSRQYTLFLFHPKLNTWLPPGGHIEPNETPEEAARREIAEEIGDVELNFVVKGDPPQVIDVRTEILLQPHVILSEQIETDHYHLDMIFIAEIDKNQKYHSPEGLDLKWFTIEEIKNTPDIFNNVKQIALKGFRLVSDTSGYWV